MNDCAKTTIALNITGMTDDGQMSVETCRAHSMTGVMNMSTKAVSYMLFSFIRQDGTIVKFKFNPDNTFTDVSFTTPITETKVNELISTALASFTNAEEVSY